MLFFTFYFSYISIYTYICIQGIGYVKVLILIFYDFTICSCGSVSSESVSIRSRLKGVSSNPGTGDYFHIDYTLSYFALHSYRIVREEGS